MTQRKNHFLVPNLGRFNDFSRIKLMPFERNFNKISGDPRIKRLGGSGSLTMRKDKIINPKPNYFKPPPVRFNKFHQPHILTPGTPGAGQRMSGSGRMNLHGNDAIL